MAGAVASGASVRCQGWGTAVQPLTVGLGAVVVTMVIGIAMGTWAARNNLVAAILRPLKDAAQTLPSFVYLVPAVA